jgi:hypothetical protein
METRVPAYVDLDARVTHEAGGFGMLWDLGTSGSGEYGKLFGGGFGYESVLIHEGGFSLAKGHFSIAAGKLAMHDELDSPYSLALSGAGNAALNLLFRYEDERFFFSDRWIALNYDSGQSFGPIGASWPDRSAVLKSYGLKFGEFRFGFQDISVYTNLGYGYASDRSSILNIS